MDRLIINLPRWLMLAALVYAPWAYGATRDWAISGLNWLLGGIFTLWAVSWLLRREWPPLPKVMVVAALALTAQAWLMASNSKFEYAQFEQDFIPLEGWAEWLPGSLHRARSWELAVQITALLSALIVITDMARSSTWRRRLIWTMGITGVSIVGLGLAQKFTHAPGIFWEPEGFGDAFFATYRNRCNAGSFLNLVWPLLAGCAVLAFLRDKPAWQRALWVCAVVLCLAGLMVNASRAPAAVGLALMGVWAGWLAWQWMRGRFVGTSTATALTTGVVLVLLVLLVASLSAFVGMDASFKRWRLFEREVTEKNARLITAKVCVEMVPEAGWWGFGPGTFQTAFPYFTQETGTTIRGRWLNAHQDYLQTLIEWGYIGGAAWTLLIGGALLAGRRARQRQEVSESARVMRFAVIVSLLGVLLHALVDFPLQIPSLQLYTLALAGLLWSSGQWASERRTEHVHRRRRKVERDELACAA